MSARFALILIPFLAAAGLAGCGAGDVIDDEKTQIAIKYDVQEATGAEVKSVTCPSNVPVSVGTRFTCAVETVSGGKAVTEVEITTERGDLKMLRLTAN